MLTVLAFDRSEIELVKKLAHWIVELGGVSAHELLLVPSRRTHEAKLHQEIYDIISPAFKKVVFHFPTTEDETGWPNAANMAWREAVRAVEWTHGDQPFFWIEADSVPLCPKWLDRIAMEFRVAVKPFMGARVLHPDVPEHMSGIAVYWHTMRWCPNYAVLQFQQGYQGPQVAWDVSLAPKILPNMFETKLIQHEWSPEPFVDSESLSRLKQEAVIYHQCKDGSLIEKLRGGRVGLMLTPGKSETSQSAGDSAKVELDRGFEPHPLNQSYPSNTIFTYFTPVNDIDAEEQQMLIFLWKYSWMKYGWNPVVLLPVGFVFDNPGLDSAGTTMANFPSVNPDGYDRACFYRWLEMSKHGGWMCDYDVMNNGFEPQPIPSRLTVYQMHNACPSLVAGNASEFLRLAMVFAERGKEFVEEVHGSPHVSDMHILQSLPEEYDQENLVKAHGSDGWLTAKAVHFANQTMNGKKPRSAWIPQLLWSAPATSNGYGGVTEGIRAHVSAIKGIIGEQPSRKIILRAELRNARLSGQPATRKKKNLLQRV